jgi:hypothetical protein
MIILAILLGTALMAVGALVAIFMGVNGNRVRCALGVGVFLVGILCIWWGVATSIAEAQQACQDRGGTLHTMGRGSLCLSDDGRVLIGK